MAKRIWNVAIVGPGWVAGAYMDAFRKRDDVRVTHIISHHREGAAAFARRYDLSCPLHDSLEAALTADDIDIVGIFTPHDLHAALAIQAAQAGKHLIIEKPIALTPEELRPLRAAVKQAGVKSITGFVLRWNPLLTMIRRNLEAGHLGKLIFAEADYLHGLVGKPYTRDWHLHRATAGNTYLLVGCHAIDAVRFLVGRPVVEVQAFETTRTDAFDYPSTGIVLMKFDDGSLGKVASCIESQMPYVFNVEVFGTEGTFRNNQFYSHMLKGQTGFATIPTTMPDSADVSHHPFDGEVAEFIDALNADRRPLPDVEDAAETMEICFAAEQSAQAGQAIRLPL